MSSDLQVVAPVLDNASAGDLVDAIRRRIAGVPAALGSVVAHRLDDDVDGADEMQWGPVHPAEVLLELFDDEAGESDDMRRDPADPGELSLEVLDGDRAREDRKAFARELGLIKRDLRSAGVGPPLGAYSREILGEARRRRRPNQTNRSMSLGFGFTVWLPEVADGFPVYPYDFVTQDDLPCVAE